MYKLAVAPETEETKNLKGMTQIQYEINQKDEPDQEKLLPFSLLYGHLLRDDKLAIFLFDGPQLRSRFFYATNCMRIIFTSFSLA